MNKNILNNDLLSNQITEFKLSIKILYNLNKFDYDSFLLTTLKKLETNLDYLKSMNNYEEILKESNFFKILNLLLNDIDDNCDNKKYLNQIIIILFKYNQNFESNSNSNDNQLFIEDKILKYLIVLFKRHSINDNEFEIEKLLLLIKSSLYYSIKYNLLKAADYKNLFDDLIFKLKELNLFKKQSQKILSTLLCSLAILLKIKENDNFINSIDFNEFIEYLQANVDYINCSNMQKLLSCLYFFITNFSECCDLFLQYDGLQFLNTIQLDKITAKIKTFIDYVKENDQKQETDKSSFEEINVEEIKAINDIKISNNKIEAQKRSFKKFVDPVYEIIGNYNELATNFDEIDLKKELLKSIYAYGFKELSAIQKRAILPCIRGNDVILAAPSGTGKKTTAIIAILQRIDNKLNECQALILTPNQSAQFCEMALKLDEHLKIKSHSCGNSVSKDIDHIINKHIISGTTGRILDLINRGVLKTENIKLLILADAEKILSKDLIINIHKKINKKELQVILLATKNSSDISEIAGKIMSDPFLISIKDSKLSLKDNELSFKGIKHFNVYLKKEEFKFEELCCIYDILYSKNIQIIVLCNTARKVDLLSERMEGEKMDVSYLFSEMDLDLRETMIKNFKNGLNRVLVTTRLSIRGVNTRKVSLIINYDVPENYKENYIDKISANGPFDQKGIIVNLVTPTNADKQRLKNIENYYRLKIEELPANYMDYF